MLRLRESVTVSSSLLRSLPPIFLTDCPISTSPFRSLKMLYPVRTSKISALSLDEGCTTDQFPGNNSMTDFMRFRRASADDDESHGDLQTSVIRYQKTFPWSLLQPFFQVDLVSTVHIADQEYFATLQGELKHYDCVLYEMVASKGSLRNRKFTGTKKPKGSRKGISIIGCIQRLMARGLVLDFQPDCLDYQTENWYHADLDYETFKLRQSERGENFFTFAQSRTNMALRSTNASTAEDLEPWKSKLLRASQFLPMPLVGLLLIGCVCTQPENSALEYPEIEALLRLDFSAAMKVLLAKRLTSEFAISSISALDGSVIVGERNRAAIQALSWAISSGHKKIAILYGAGHMPDLDRRLRQELDLVPNQVRWITAWSVRKRDLDIPSSPFLGKLAKLSGWRLNRYQTLALLIFSAALAVDLWLWELFLGTVVNGAALVAAQVVQFAENIRII